MPGNRSIKWRKFIRNLQLIVLALGSLFNTSKAQQLNSNQKPVSHSNQKPVSNSSKGSTESPSKGSTGSSASSSASHTTGSATSPIKGSPANPSKSSTESPIKSSSTGPIKGSSTGSITNKTAKLPPVTPPILTGHPGKNDTIVLAGYIINGDTLAHIWLGTIDVKDKMIYHNDAEKIKYLTLRRDVLKVLPFARSAGYKYRMLQWQLSQTTDRKKKRELEKALEKDIKDNYEKPLKDLTITQGRILIKLIDRETGQTSYQLVKNLKSGFSAFMFQSIAGLIGDNLKEHYDPQQDKDIEFIIQSFGY